MGKKGVVEVIKYRVEIFAVDEPKQDGRSLIRVLVGARVVLGILNILANSGKEIWVEKSHDTIERVMVSLREYARVAQGTSPSGGQVGGA